MLRWFRAQSRVVRFVLNTLLLTCVFLGWRSFSLSRFGSAVTPPIALVMLAAIWGGLVSASAPAQRRDDADRRSPSTTR